MKHESVINDDDFGGAFERSSCRHGLGWSVVAIWVEVVGRRGKVGRRRRVEGRVVTEVDKVHVHADVQTQLLLLLLLFRLRLTHLRTQAQVCRRDCT